MEELRHVWRLRDAPHRQGSAARERLGESHRLAVKGSTAIPLQALGAAGGSISRQSAHEGDKVGNPSPPGKIPGTDFC